MDGTTTAEQSGIRRNDNERVFPPSPDLQSWNLTIRCSLVSCLGHPFLNGYYLSAGDTVSLFPSKSLATSLGEEKFWIQNFYPDGLFYFHVLQIINEFKRTCPWCNGYRRRKWTRRYEFKSWTRMIAFHIALIPLGKVWIQLFSH